MTTPVIRNAADLHRIRTVSFNALLGITQSTNQQQVQRKTVEKSSITEEEFSVVVFSAVRFLLQLKSIYAAWADGSRTSNSRLNWFDINVAAVASS